MQFCSLSTGLGFSRTLFGLWLWRWMLLGLLGCCSGLSAQTITSTTDTPVTQSWDWAQSGLVLPLTPHLQYFKEQPGQPLNWQQALTHPDWSPADPKSMAALHHASTLWMQIEVENSGTMPQTRWVVVDYWALMDVQMFVLDAAHSQLLAHQQSGQRLAPQDRAINSEKAAFAVTLLPGERALLLMRVSDLYWSHMEIDAWDGPTYVQAQTRQKLGFAVTLGVVLALLVVLLLQRDKHLAIVAAWMVLSLLLELTYAGLISEFVVPARVLSPVMILLLLGVLINSASSFVTMYFMGLQQHRFWRRWNWGLLLVSLTVALWMLDERSNTSRQLMSLLNALQVLSNITLLAWAKIRGNRLRQWMVVIMGTNFMLAIARIAMRQLYVDPEIFDLISNLVLGIKGCLVLTVIGLVALQRWRDMRDVRQRLLLSEQQQRDDLKMAVEQRTAELHQALLAANEANNAKTDFLARVSHDLRSPLTSIKGYAELLQGEGGHTHKLAQTIRRSAEHMQVMVNDLIEYARGSNADHAKPVPVYIHGMLDDVASQANALATQHHNRFILKLKNQLPPVLVLDAKRLRQILINLLDNAAKFTHHGEVALVVSAQSVGHETLELQFAVRDTGEGISSADQRQLFEPFFRSARTQNVPGLGLGLSIVRTWVERLGGTITLKSELGQGSTFTLRLPVRVGSELDMTQPLQHHDAAYLPPLDGNKRRIWVVEDNPDIRELLVEGLHRHGFDVTASPDGTDFVTRMQTTDTAPPSLVLTDYLMPGVDGAGVLQAVRAHWPSVPVVLLSATQKTMQAMGVAQEEGFDASLVKPVNLADLRATLATLLHLDTVPNSQNSPNQTTPSPLAQANQNGLHQSKPPTQELERIREWVEMGAVTDLAEWAETLARKQPEYAPFATHVLTLLEQARVDDIRAILLT